jgi:uncharacterized protein
VNGASAHTDELFSLAVQEGLRVSARLRLPAAARACYVLAHGAGAGMDHPFMRAAADELCALGIATLRYQFPYMERRARRPDPPPLCHATVRAALAQAADRAAALPLHPAGRPSDTRAQHLAEVRIPMLFVQGARDALAERARIEALVSRLGARAILHEVEDADHSFHVPARSGRKDAEVRSALLRAVAQWMDTLL